MEKYSPMRSLPWLWVLLSFALLVFSGSGVAFHNTCHREPQNALAPKTIGDGDFRIKISGNPEKYVPGEVYTVSLQGQRNQYTVQKFAGFTLVVESTSRFEHFGPQSVGTFQLYGDVLTMHSEGCPNAVIQTSNILKNEIQVLWTAPPSGSGCLRFKSTVVEQRDIWYMDDGELTKDLCEEVQDHEDEQPQTITECCLCNEAKYEVTFEGLWSRQTHPKDFPANEWLTHFSDIIGASHSNDYRVWEYGGLASDGLRQVAEWGSTRTLESELKRQRSHIRTIIKARGLWYPSVNGKTFAVFRVDKTHHLMSLVSMLGPSPDWIVGVSALELCSKNCSWVAQKTLNLYPWDAGTDSAATYMSSNSPTIPRQKIRRITNSYPNDQMNPFYDPKGLPMKPLARLTVTRQRVYEKTCANTNPPDEIYPNHFGDEFENERPECVTTEWSEFSPCSVTCGKGLRMRTRQYRIPMKADMLRCDRQMEEKEMCAAQVPICHNGSEDDRSARITYYNPSCQTSEWSHWTPCSTTCGEGTTMRYRRYLDRMGRKKCANGLTEQKTCMADIPECEGKNEEPTTDPSCAVTPWTNWSPCSVTCGKGVRSRTRYFLVPAMTDASCGVQTISKMICEGERRNCTIGKAEAKEVCLQELKVGPCRGYFPRWYYDSEKRMCLQFTFGGCRGNMNNFKKYDECTRMCEFSRAELHSDSNHNFNSPPFDTIRNTDGNHASSVYDYTTENDSDGPSFDGLTSESQLGPTTDCMMSPWNEWSGCSVTCGNGWRQKRRMVKAEPRNGGKSCPKKKVRRRKCKQTRCNKANHNNLQSFSQMFEPYSKYSSAILPSSTELRNLMPSPPHQASPLNNEEDLLIDRKSANEDCVMGDWGPWSPCTHSCGSESLQQRARSIVVKARGRGIPCGPSLERRYCSLPPCPRSRG